MTDNHQSDRQAGDALDALDRAEPDGSTEAVEPSGPGEPGEPTGSGAPADVRAGMGGAAQAAFAEEIERLRSTGTGGPLDKAVAGLGLGAVAVGLVTCVVAYSQATGFDDVRDQMESLILAVFGVGLVVFGSVLYLRNSVTRFLRFWLLRVIYEQRDLAGRAPETETAAQPRMRSAVRSSRE